MHGPIIFVEDDLDDHYIYREICATIGVSNELKFFASGEKMLEYLRETLDKPFIIFCDINMPEMDGLELRRQINEQDDLRRRSLPFVFSSSAATPQQVRDAYDLTVQGFFIKQQSFADAVSTIKMILDYWGKCFHPNRLDA